MRDYYKFIRWLAYTLEILIVFSIQQTPNLVPPIMGARPILLIPILVSIAMFENEIVGMWFGVFIGLLIDFGLGSILGFNCIIMAVSGCILGLLAINLIRVNFLTASIATIALSVLVFSLRFLFGYVIPVNGGEDYFMIYHYLPRCIYTILISPIFYFLNRTIATMIAPKND